MTAFFALSSHPGTFLPFPRNLFQKSIAPSYPSKCSAWAICSGRSNAGAESVRGDGFSPASPRSGSELEALVVLCASGAAMALGEVGQAKVGGGNNVRPAGVREGWTRNILLAAARLPSPDTRDEWKRRTSNYSGKQGSGLGMLGSARMGSSWMWWRVRGGREQTFKPEEEHEASSAMARGDCCCGPREIRSAARTILV